MSARHSPRSRRVDEALSQLVVSLTPPLSLSAIGDDIPDDTETFAAIEAQRNRENYDRSWRIIDAYSNSPNDPVSPSGGVNRRGSLAGGENINNAPDLIKRKLLRENASPDKAVRFSNMYSRLLTQPVLSQKWAILYLLYRLSSSDDNEEYLEDGERSRSPPMEPDNLQNMLWKGQRPRRGTGPRMVDTWDEEGPAISSSASQLPARKASLRRPERIERIERPEIDADPEPERFPEQMVHHLHHEQPNNTPGGSFSADEQGAAQRPPTAETQKNLTRPAEHGLLHDLPFNLQGLSSSSLEFTSSSVIKLPPSLPIPMISLLNTIAEPCLLYRKLAGFVEDDSGGLLNQSLRAALSNELRSYLSLIATLEGEIRRALMASEDSGNSISASKSGVTLKRCAVWTRDATMALRLMSLIVEEAQSKYSLSRREIESDDDPDKKGGQLISLIHGFSTSHGDPFVCAFAERLLAHVTRPFYDMLRLWIYDGELSDPFKEFFVVEPEFRPATDPRRIATSVWEDKYKLDDEMVPSIITQDFAKKVFLIGKSLNFIRYGCGDSGWVEAYSKEASKELRYGDTASLETSIDEAYKTTMAQLIHLMNDKFRLFDHLNALKKYLLLGQGDFIALLMESLASNLDRPANSQYRHTLTAQLEHAIRASNAQYDSPDVLRRLDARMLELSHGEIGWDCFTLEYKIDAPVDVVITPWASTQYLKMFNFLWRVKRVEFALGSTWRRCMTGARGVLGSVEDKVGSDWKRARCVIAEMIHFVCQLQWYILFEVIESSWNDLQARVSKPGCTLDDLIEAHTDYLNSITRKGLLGSTSSANKHQEETFLTQLHQILKIMLAYKDAVDGLYSFSVAEFTRRQELSARIETRTAQGRWGVTEHDLLASSRQHKNSMSSVSASVAQTPNVGNGDGADTPSSLDLSVDDHMLASLRVRLRELSAEFRSRLNIFLGDIAYHSETDMRFLGVAMNFNDVYEPVRRRRTTGVSSRDRDRERARRKAAASGANGEGSGQRETKRDREKTKEQEKDRREVESGGNASGSGT